MTRKVRGLAVCLGIAAGLLILGLGALAVALSRSPVDLAAFRATEPRSTRIFDRNGILLREVANAAGERAYPVPLAAVSPLLVEAILAAEDSSFRCHGGVDLSSVARALLSNLTRGRVVSGASTLTMQLARLAFGGDHDFGGKLAQAYNALRLERALGKDEILEAYLNRVPYGRGRLGVEAACLEYLGKPCRELSLPEAALVAGLIQAPSLYDPARNPEGARARRNYVLGRLLATGRIAKAAHDEASAAPLPAATAAENVKAGHFTDYVLSLSPGIWDVETSLDWSLQERVQTLTSEYVRKASAAGLTNAAVVVLDNESGSILSMVGSKEWTAEEGGFVNGALAPRQPGSALKPFAYALAFEKGYTPASMLADIETDYVSSDRSLYVPRNYSRTFRGPVLAKEALASSLNIPAIRLVRSVGLAPFLDELRALGFVSLDRDADYYGLGLVLGNGEVNLLEMARAYSTLARGGVSLPVSCLLPGVAAAPVRVLDYDAAWLVTSILSDENMRVQAFGADSPLLVGFPMAIKTGTSGDWRDSWTVGYTGEFTIAVWGGDFESTPMNQVSGSTGAGPLFNQVAKLMADRLGKLPSLPEPPEGARRLVVCAESGAIPNSSCPRRMVVSVIGAANRPLCTMHETVTVDSRTGLPADASTPQAFQAKRLAYNLPPLYASWLAQSGKYSPPPPAADKSAGRPILSILSPRSGDVYIIEPGYDRSTQTIELTAEVARRSKPASLSWFIDGKLVGEAAWPYSASWRLEAGRHSVVAKVGEVGGDEVVFTVR
jgi:penicillin-binding protein 1C